MGSCPNQNCLSVTEVKYSYRVNMLGTLVLSVHSVLIRAPFAHTPLPRATHPSEMVRCTDEGYRIEDERWSEISERLGTDGGANEHANVGTRPDHPYSPFQPRRVRASGHRRSALLRSACAACRVRASRARVRACVARVRACCSALLCPCRAPYCPALPDSSSACSAHPRSLSLSLTLSLPLR